MMRSSKKTVPGFCVQGHRGKNTELASAGQSRNSLEIFGAVSVTRMQHPQPARINSPLFVREACRLSACRSLLGFEGR